MLVYRDPGVTPGRRRGWPDWPPGWPRLRLRQPPRTSAESHSDQPSLLPRGAGVSDTCWHDGDADAIRIQQHHRNRQLRLERHVDIIRVGETHEHEVAEGVALELAVGEAVLERLRPHSVVTGEGDEAPADVTGRRHAEVTAEPA
jgi:hypothetical protein